LAGLSAREAGVRVGLTKQAILKAIHKGTISATKAEAGEWRIEPAELFRVYPATATADDNRPATDEVAGLRRENKLLREMIADLRGPGPLARAGDAAAAVATTGRPTRLVATAARRVKAARHRLATGRSVWEDEMRQSLRSAAE
jgi:hypothetical protein